jgi:hypothetical protein
VIRLRRGVCSASSVGYGLYTSAGSEACTVSTRAPAGWPSRGPRYRRERMFARERAEPIYQCEDCGRRYAYDYRRGHSKRQCNSCRSNRGGLEGRRMRQALKRRMVAYKGGKCQRCGYDGCIAALCFHHVTDDKRFGVAGAHHRSWSSLCGELDKCVLLCLNCHAEEHDVAEQARYGLA